jgi:hypothetical protein
MAPDTPYQVVIKTVEAYLGPTSQRFVDRQITSHLKKEPHTLTSTDIPKLADWVKVSMSVITGDKKIVDECVRKILEAASPDTKISVSST